MPVTSLQCPNCGGDLPDESRGTFSLYGIHADYLCPHCETVLCWEKPLRMVRQRLILFSLLPFTCITVTITIPLIWRLVNGRPSHETPGWLAIAAIVPALLAIGIVRFLRSREPWILKVKKDPMQEIWALEADELKLRSRPGLRW